MTNTNQLTHCGYNAGHPWYYFKGGKIPRLREIRASAISSSYRGYLASDIDEIDKLSEPRRSAKLRAMCDDVCADLDRDIRRYRVVASELRRFRAVSERQSIAYSCDDVHTSMSLKHNHIYNGFAHLHVIGGLLEKQPDLFSL